MNTKLRFCFHLRSLSTTLKTFQGWKPNSSYKSPCAWGVVLLFRRNVLYWVFHRDWSTCSKPKNSSKICTFGIQFATDSCLHENANKKIHPKITHILKNAETTKFAQYKFAWRKKIITLIKGYGTAHKNTLQFSHRPLGKNNLKLWRNRQKPKLRLQNK